MKKVLIFGLGYVSKFLLMSLKSAGYTVYLSSRTAQGPGIFAMHDPKLAEIILAVDFIISTVPNVKELDPILEEYGSTLAVAKLEAVIYLSTTSVYGDHQGAWVDENSVCLPKEENAKIRLKLEQAWLLLFEKYALPVHILRLAGIYGPGRNALLNIQAGKDYTVYLPDHYFSRIHVLDICKIILKILGSASPGEIFNVSDDEPAPLYLVEEFASSLVQV